MFKPNSEISSNNLASSSQFAKYRSHFYIVANNALDQSILYPKTRWIVFLSLFTGFIIRMYLTSGFYIVAYILGIHLFNLLVGFISPQIDPETDAYILPVRESDEFRPFQRSITEFKFWWNGIRALVLGVFATFLPLLDIPVFWPILLLYFLFLVFIPIKEQIKNMIKYKYVPFSWGKQTYRDITRTKTFPARTPNSMKAKVSFPSLHTTNPSISRHD